MSIDVEQFENRKQDHIKLALDDKHQARERSGLDEYQFVHDALPEIDFKDVSIQCDPKQAADIFGDLATPFFVSGMTAGHADADWINRRIAASCEKRGWIFGVGSQRREFFEGDFEEAIKSWSNFSESFPKLKWIGNLGASQLQTLDEKKFTRFVSESSMAALAIHLNPLQEIIQPEGTPHFKGVIERLSQLCELSSVPIMIKETGSGLSARTLEKIQNLKLCALDVSGLGGTHWGRIEGSRAIDDPVRAQAALTFADWGESTASSVKAAARLRRDQQFEIWASGGVRSGLDAAKLIALGATRVGFAMPALRAAMEGVNQLEQWMETQEFELKSSLFLTGSLRLNELSGHLKQD